MKKFLWLFTALVLVAFLNAQPKEYEGRAVWAHPGDFGKSEKEVEQFFKILKKSNIELLIPLVKDTAGNIFWHSKKFPQAIHPDYKDFDLLRAITKCGRLYNIRVHAWLCDFPEGKESAAFKLHPEWAMVNPQGGYTSEEKVTPDVVYGSVWMCPARRPGYTDQWLLPMIEEIVGDYDVDGIHHDYVRYPGDVAPDTYCFCDYCLEHFFKYNHFYYFNRPQDRIPLKKERVREEANWDSDFTVNPPNWLQMSREQKAEFILSGKSINRSDLDYFFYQARCDAITDFVREAWERASKIKPGVEFSAAVFINPMLSGRFIGQRWTDFAPWVDIIMPMNYRSHFQGSFDDYLDYLGEIVQAQVGWCKGKSHLYAGIDAHYIFKEEREPWEKALAVLKKGQGAEAQKEELENLMEKNIAYLRNFSAQRAKDLDEAFSSFLKGKIQKEGFAAEINKVLSDPPAGFFPEEKLVRTIEAVRKAQAEGIVIFAASLISGKKLWSGVEKAYSSPAKAPDKSLPLKDYLSIQAVRKTQK